MQEEALNLLEQIRQHVISCCAVTMEPEEVEELIDQLKVIIEKKWNQQ
jgi:hypothetical protein|tara:strand:+ start:51 stop:194 length:144 start_codon:yes stop_codon:yes gene_type:complete